MIARIRGKLAEIGFSHVVVDVNGVGYRIFIPMSTYDRLPNANQEVTLLTYTCVREDAMHLYGFATEDEKQLFELLIGTTGIGPKLALNILSTMPVKTFCQAIGNSDINVIKQINGVGKRTAERMIVELKDKIGKLTPGFTAGSAAPAIPDDKAVAAEEALLALEQLGFKRDKISKTLHDLIAALPAAECSAENLIRKALQSLNS